MFDCAALHLSSHFTSAAAKFRRRRLHQTAWENPSHFVFVDSDETSPVARRFTVRQMDKSNARIRDLSHSYPTQSEATAVAEALAHLKSST